MNVGVALGQSWLVHYAWIAWLLWAAFAIFLFMALREIQWIRRYFWRVTSYMIPPPLPFGGRNECHATNFPKQAPMRDLEHDGPNVVVEYSYSDSDGPAKQSQPLVLKNISNRDAAHNVRVLPITVGQLKAKFEPDVVPFIEPLNRKEVKVNIDGVSPMLRDILWLLFKRDAKNTGDLFAQHPYKLLIEYEDADSVRLFETSVVLRYRAWKNKISTGETGRRIKKPI